MVNAHSKKKKRWTVPELRRFKKGSGSALTMITAYDATQARWCAESPCDLLLVGDSVGMTVQGHRDTLSVTMDQMAYHTECVRRGAPESFVVADMPFGSYQVSEAEGMRNAVRLIACGATMVKLEGAGPWLPLVERLVAAGVPVMGHLGLTPQSVHQLGGFRPQGRDTPGAAQLMTDARRLQDAGCAALVLESIPAPLATEVTSTLTIPTIGIGAGSHTDGQVLVLHDLLGMNLSFKPRFVKNFARLEEAVAEALASYCEEVRSGRFPADEHTLMD